MEREKSSGTLQRANQIKPGVFRDGSLVIWSAKYVLRGKEMYIKLKYCRLRFILNCLSYFSCCWQNTQHPKSKQESFVSDQFVECTVYCWLTLRWGGMAEGPCRGETIHDKVLAAAAAAAAPMLHFGLFYSTQAISLLISVEP